MLLGVIIIATVLFVLGIRATSSYLTQKTRLQEDMQQRSEQSMTRLQKNIATFIEAYQANEYEKLVATEIELSGHFAIIVHDYNMAQVLGQDLYVSGKIHNAKGQIVDYEQGSATHAQSLKNSYYAASADIMSSMGKRVGKITIYMSDDAIQKALRSILQQTLINTFVISLLLVILLFLAIHFSLVRPLSQIARVIQDSDSDGIPLAKIPDYNYRELAVLTDSMNTMIEVIRESRQSLQVQHDSLEHSLRINRLILETIPDLLWLKDSEGKYIMCNPNFAAFFGAKEAEISGKTDYDFVDSTLADSFRDHDQKAMYSDEPCINEEWITFADTGRRALVETTKVPLLEKNGEITGVLGIAHDITAHKESEAALIKAREAADAANRAKSAFLANMSHELRTPMNAVLGFAQILEKAPDLNPEYRHMVKTINRSGEYLLTLLNDILDLSKIEAKRFDINVAPCDLRLLLDGIVDIFIARAQQKGLKFNKNLAANLPRYVETDEKRLRQILLNLLGNALKFTEKGTISLCCSYFDTTIYMKIEDTGIGIEAEKLEKIFEPFQQSGDDRYKSQGTGLGLAISRKLAQLMGGGIDVNSAIGQGSAFIVSIPVTVLTSSTEYMVINDNNTSIIGYQRDNSDAPYRILIVDDIANNREVLRNILQPLGFEVHEVDSGEACLDLLHQQQPDVIFMDLKMPGISGVDTVQQIRARNITVPIIVISASAFEEDLSATSAAGCNEHLAKPIDSNALLDSLKRHLTLQWIYQDVQSEAPATDESHVLSDKQREELLSLLDAGKVELIFNYLNTLKKDAEYAEVATQLFKITERFDLLELRKKLQ
jgi:PAS domain S-box-containing protein